MDVSAWVCEGCEVVCGCGGVRRCVRVDDVCVCVCVCGGGGGGGGGWGGVGDVSNRSMKG